MHVLNTVIILMLLMQGPRFAIDRVAHDDFIYQHLKDVFPLIAHEINNEIEVSDGRVLEIAFTAPYVSMELASICEAQFDIVVADTLEANICMKRIEKKGLTARFTIHIGDMDSLPFEEMTFDLVLAREAMRFWQSNEAAYREINRVLTESGSAILGAGIGIAVTSEQTELLWGLVRQWRQTTGHEPWATTKPVVEDIEKAICAAGIGEYTISVEGDCKCSTMVQWYKCRDID